MGSAKLVCMLLKHGVNVSAEDKRGRTPLHQVAETWSAELIHMLLKQGTNVAVEDKKGRTPLH